MCVCVCVCIYIYIYIYIYIPPPQLSLYSFSFCLMQKLLTFKFIYFPYYYKTFFQNCKYGYKLGRVKSFAIFWWHEAQFSCSRCFCLGHEGNQPHQTVRYWGCLILSQCYLPYLPLWLRAPLWNPPFKAYLTLPYCHRSCNLREISWTIWLL